MHLNWLEIHQYPRVAPGTKLIFDRGINMAVGKNGTGKTTLLELVAMIASGDLSPFERTEFDIAWHASADGLEFEIRLTNEVKPTSVKPGSRRRPSWSFPATLRGTSNIQLDGNAGSLSWTLLDERGQPLRTIQSSTTSPFDSSFPFELSHFGVPNFLMPFANMEVACAGRFDEALGVHLAILGEAAPRSRQLPRPAQLEG
ncbi:MAG: hypothetical protein ACI9OJ_002370 [Myxococcota bacterium]|jgi:hypothetical protein